MDDSEARFARRLGLAVGRLDWWKIREEHSTYEWALQQIADTVDPLGPERDDMRAARIAISIISAIQPGSSTEELQETASNLRNYLPFNQPEEDRVLMPEEAEELRESQGVQQ